MNSTSIRALALCALLLFTPAAQAGTCGSGHDATTASSTPDIVDTAVAAGTFENLVAAVQVAELVDVLKGDGPFTVFAPTDDAFAALGDGTVASLLRPENREQLVAVLTYHVIPGRVSADEAFRIRSADTVQGDAVRFAFRDGAPRVNEARLVTTDIAASNGVIHVIDAVLLPQTRIKTAAEGLIERAIERGAPLFNDGNAEACAGIYVTAADGLLALESVPEEAKEVLERALRRAGRTGDVRDQAWILRGALDEVYDTLGTLHTAMNP